MADTDRIDDLLRDLAAVLKKHNCLISTRDRTLTLHLAEITDAASMTGRVLASLSYITPRSAEYQPRGCEISIRWSANTPALERRELEVVQDRSLIEKFGGF